MNRIVTIKRHWLATLLAAVCILMGSQTAWAQDDPVTYDVTRTARTNNVFTFTQPSNNVEVTVTYVDAKASIRPTGNTDATNDLYYLTLADALADAADGDVIKLLADETITTRLTINNSITLDLNGHTLTCTGTNEVALTVSSGKTVTIQDGGTGGGITGTLAGIDNKGTLTVTGGTITGTSNNGNGIYNSANATLTVSGGTITCSGNSGYGIANVNATLTVSGGAITCSGTNGCGISNTVNATLTISGTPTISATGTGGTGIYHSGTAFNLSGSPTISGTYVDISLNTDKIITINGALTAPTTGETPVADPWTVKSDNIEDAPSTSYIFTTGFSTYCKVGEDVADPAAYFDCITANITTRLASNEAQFVLYIPLDADVAETVPVITNNGQTDVGTRAASLDEGNVWVGDQLSVSTTATPGITWQWYRVSGTTETAISEATASTYTLTADDVGFTIIAKATQPANIAGIGHPASDVVVATAATVAVVKKDNFGELAAIAAPTMDYIGATIATAAEGTEYMVIESSDAVLAEDDARWSLATEGAGADLTLNKYIAIENETAVEKNMLPGTTYKLYYRLKENTTTKHGNTLTTNTKPVNEANVAITTLAWDYQITSAGVTYELSHDATTGMATTTTTAKVVAVPATGTGDHKTATILASIPADNAALIARLDVWKVLGYTLNDETTPTAFAAAIAVDADAFDNDMTLAAVGSTLATYGCVKAFDDGMFAWLMSGTPQAICTEEGYQIYLMNGGYYAVCNASDEYAMAGKSKRIEETMSAVLTIDGLTGSDQGAVIFKDKVGTPLPISDTAPNTGKIVAAPGQKVTVEVTLPAGFGFKDNDDNNKKITVTYSTTTVEKTLASTSDTRVWTAEFDMPSSNVTVSFKEDEPLEGFDVTFDYTAPTAGGAVAAATGSPTADGTVKVLQTLTYTLTPTTPAADAEGAGYALTALGLPDGITPTIVLASNEETAVTLPTEQSVKVTFTVPATYTTTSTVTFAPVFTNTYENISFAAGKTTYKYSDTQGIALHGENADLTFYTVTGVSGSTVTTAEITSKQIPAGLPVIVQNASGAAIVARMDIGTYDAVTYDDTHFYGTVEAKTTTDEGYGPWHWADNTKYYGFNGLGDFVWINGAGNVAAHRCWLELSATTSAPALTIQWPDGETTSIDVRSKREDVRNETFYDLSGRKLQAKPQRKGVYILNGQKKVVK